MTKKAWIFDIDNTIANIENRIHHLRKSPKDWDSWHKDYYKDTPNLEIVEILQLGFESGIKIILCTGRDEKCFNETVDWLNEHNISFDRLYMRPLGDRRNDSDVKKELLDEMRKDGYNPICVFEDRDRVVEMWRNEGLRCFQVAPGNF